MGKFMAEYIPLLLPFHMNLRWRKSDEDFKSYAILIFCVGETKKKDRERETNKQTPQTEHDDAFLHQVLGSFT